MDAIVVCCGECRRAAPGIQWTHTKWSRRELAVYYAVVDSAQVPVPFRELRENVCEWKVKGVPTPAYTCAEFKAVWSSSSMGTNYLNRNAEIMYSEIARDVHTKLADLAKKRPIIAPLTTVSGYTAEQKELRKAYVAEVTVLQDVRKQAVVAEDVRHAAAQGQIERNHRKVSEAATPYDQVRLRSERVTEMKAENAVHAENSIVIERTYRVAVRASAAKYSQRSPV
jgi:hypothetical protein